MGKIRHYYVGACLLVSSAAFAQVPSHSMYVNESSKSVPFYEAYSNWQPGTPLFSDAAAEDEEFFISRVKPKERFTNSATQVDPEMTPDRKLIWWCPIGTADGGGWKSLPSYFFDSEVFSMWSYVDIYGNWTAPMIRMAGAFTDICHKNGVRTSTLASVPWASTVTATDGGHGQTMKAMIDGGADKLLKFLRYYGIDGIGYNSEFSIGSGLSADGLKTLLSQCFAKREAAKWPYFTNAWYSLMTSGGTVGGGDALSSSNQDWFHWNGNPTSDAYFMNYNWGASGLSTSQSTAKSFAGRSSYDVYGGMDFQGRSVADWIALKNAEISVGIWGAHNMNMIFEGRGELGSSPLTKQKTYQLISENVFTGSTYNPVNDLKIQNILRHSTTATDFHGFSKFITARSVLASDDLAAEPFVTYFNLGNGTFFNVKGETTFKNEWYNIGMQDYLPTWRWWFTANFMGRDVTDVPSKGLKAEFTWDDAWFGGSCLSIAGQTDREYLHLFKTQYSLKSGDVLTIRYKVVSGTGSVAVACSAEGKEGTEVSATVGNNITSSKEWVAKTIKVGTLPGTLRLNKETLAMLGLRFEKTSADFKVLIGEISLTRSDALTPNQPIITNQKLLAANYKGLDFKVFFKMKDRDAAHPEDPIYNEDVNTWYYKIYIQQEGGEPVMCTATTSWAAYVVSAPFDVNGDKKVKLGVSAVALDGKSESEIAWTGWLDTPDNSTVEGIEIDKPVIKSGETFAIKYIDPTHAPADKWEILNAQTGVVVKDFPSSVSLETALSEIGIYDLRITSGENIELHQALIQISSEEVGAMPEIKTLTANDSDSPISIEKGDKVTYKYIGRNADGYVSRGLRLNEIAFGVPADQLNFNSQSPFTIAFWFKPAVFNHISDGTHLLNIRAAEDRWPDSDWGWLWTHIQASDNKLSFNLKKKESGAGSETKIIAEDFTFVPNQWYHLAVVVDYQNGRNVSLYVNGKLINSGGGITNVKDWKNSYTIMVGGIAANRAGFDGYLDEFQLYNKGLTAEEVKKSMEHQTVIPESLIGYWDFETEPNENNEILSTGSNKTLKGYMTEIKTVSQGVNQYVPVDITYGTGAPFISGSIFKVETKPSWKLEEAQIQGDITGTGEAGSVVAAYPSEGEFNAILTLENGWGSVSKTYRSVTVTDGGVGFADNELEIAYNAYPNPFVDELNIRFANEGTYAIEVCDAAGKMIDAKETTVADGENIHLSVNGAAGIYFINIKQDTKILKALKVIKK